MEALVAIALVGIGVASSITALTQANKFASVSRNSTGAYAAVMNQIDVIQSIGPFNPLAGQIPKDATNNPPLYDLNPGTHVIGSTGNKNTVPVYQYTDPKSGLVQVVLGNMQVKITPSNDTTTFPGATVVRYLAQVALSYNYLGHSYSFTMDTVRTSDE